MTDNIPNGFLGKANNMEFTYNNRKQAKEQIKKQVAQELAKITGHVKYNGLELDYAFKYTN